MGTQINGAARRLVTAAAAGALVTGALSMGGVPAYAAENNLRGTVVDPQGNPVNGWLYIRTADGMTAASDFVMGGRIEATIPESGDFRLEFQPSSGNRLQTEFYLDKATLAEATPVAGAAGTVQLSPWTIDYRPFVKGVVTDAAGVPIEDAYVQVSDAATNSYEGAVWTEDDGTFHLPTFGPEPVKVRVEADDFATEWYNDQPSFATANAVSPTSAGADLGTIALTKGASISGVVTSDAGAPLELVRVQATDPDTGFVRSDYTNASGAYTIEGLPTDSYRIQASDWEIGEYEWEYYQDTQDPAAATLVPAAKDQAVGGINLSLAPAEVEPVTGADVTGKVVDETGKPVVGVDVYAYSTPADFDDRVGLEGAVTNRQGVYVLDEVDGVPDDAIKVYAEGFGPREKDGFGVDGAYLGNTDAWDAATAIPTNSFPRTGADIAVVTNGGISGKVTSEAGGALKYAYATAYDEDGDYVQDASIKSDGTYKFNTLEPGTYTVAFTADAHISEFWNNTVRSSATKVVVTSAKMVTGIDAVLTKTLVAVARPTITGEPLVGSTLTADKGTWNRMAGATYGYEWLADGAVVGTGSTLVLTAAHFGKTMAVRVSSKVETYEKVFTGQAVSDSTAAVQAATTTKAKAKKGKVKVNVAAGTVAAALVDGKVTVKLQVTKKKLVKIVGGKVKDGKAKLKIKKILKSKKLKKQLAKMKPKKAKKAKLVFVFTGKNLLESSDAIKMKKILKAAKKGKKGKKGKN
jgi:hypothetical protein